MILGGDDGTGSWNRAQGVGGDALPAHDIDRFYVSATGIGRCLRCTYWPPTYRSRKLHIDWGQYDSEGKHHIQGFGEYKRGNPKSTSSGRVCDSRSVCEKAAFRPQWRGSGGKHECYAEQQLEWQDQHKGSKGEEGVLSQAVLQKLRYETVADYARDVVFSDVKRQSIVNRSMTDAPGGRRIPARSNDKNQMRLFQSRLVKRLA